MEHPALRRIVVVLVVFASLTLPEAAIAGHSSNLLGNLIVRIPCCGGVALQGSRVSIQTPPAGSYATPFGKGGLSSVSVEANGLMQLGVKQSNNVGYHTAACEQPSLTYWVEIFDQNGTRCHYIGWAVTSATHKFSIQRQNPSLWYQVFMDGVPPGGNVIRSIPSLDGNLWLVRAGGEITYRTIGGSTLPARWHGRYSGAYETRWQRWNVNQGWYTIQGWNDIRQHTGWNFDTAQFPVVWWAWFV